MMDCDTKCYFFRSKMLHITVVKLYWQIRTQINVNPWSGKISHCFRATKPMHAPTAIALVLLS